METYLRTPVGRRSDRKSSTSSYKQSTFSDQLPTKSQLIPKAYYLVPEKQLSAVSNQISVFHRCLPIKTRLIPKIYHLIPFLFLVFVSCGAVLAQEPVGHTAPAAQAESKAIDLTSLGIQIGEKVPDITINNIHNYKSSAAKLSDFKGKLLILDFWATWCSPCIAMIPKMDSLQKEFGDKVQFLSVTYQTEEEVLPFLNKLEEQHGKKYDLPFAVNDTSLRKVFPHKTLPHYVWIDHTGRVGAITTPNEINRPNIEVFDSGKTLDLRSKRDVFLNYSPEYSLFSSDNESNTKVYGRSILTGYLEGAGSGSYKDVKVPNGKIYKRITARNLSLLKLYGLIYSDDGDLLKNRIVLDVQNKELFDTDLSGMEYIDWVKENGYSYERLLPTSEADVGFYLAQGDLAKYFPQYTAYWETRQIECWSLERIKGLTNLSTVGGAPVATFDRFGATLRNCYLSVLLGRLGYYFQNSMPLFDNTGFSGFVDMQINGSLSDMDNLNKELLNYGLKFIKANRPIKMLIIKDNPNYETDQI